MCYRCSYTKSETGTGGFDFILNQLSKLSDEHCKMKRDDDITQINHRECPDPGQGYVSKCVAFNGTATVTIALLGGEFTWNLI